MSLRANRLHDTSHRRNTPRFAGSLEKQVVAQFELSGDRKCGGAGWRRLKNRFLTGAALIEKPHRLARSLEKYSSRDASVTNP